MDQDRDELNILAPRTLKPKLDYLHREVQHAAGRPISRRRALGLGGMALFAAAAEPGPYIFSVQAQRLSRLYP